MSFPAAPVPDGSTVEIIADIFPLLLPGVHDTRQLQVWFNGQLLKDLRMSKDEPLRLQIPASFWNERSKSAVVQWKFPDALSLTELSTSKDPRPLAFGFRKLEFSLAR